MNAAALTRLRVAQATRTPVSAEQIREMLRVDEAAENAGEQRVETLLQEWIDLGVVREVGEDPVLYVLMPVFRDDLARRIAGHLLRPRTLLSLEREVATDTLLPNLREHGLEPLVRDLVEAGLVVELEGVEDADTLVDEVDDRDDTIDLHPDARKILQEQLSATDPVSGVLRRGWEFEAGSFFVLSRKGLDALQVT